MNAKITKLRADNARDREKIASLQAKCKKRDQQIRELENTEIIGLVRETGMTIEQFAELFQNMKGALPPAQVAPPQEEADDEEI